VIFQALWFEPAEDAVAVLGETPEIAIELLIPVGKGAQMGEVLDLIDVTGAQAATVGFLQGDQIIVTQYFADALQVAGATGMRQQMLPAARQVVVVALGADANLDVEAKQP